MDYMLNLEFFINVNRYKQIILYHSESKHKYRLKYLMPFANSLR